MTMNMRTWIVCAGLMIVALVGCSALPGSRASDVPPGAATPDAALHETAPPDVPNASEIGSPAPSSSAGGGLFPWLPPVDPDIAATFQVDTFVTARADVVPVSGIPGGPPYRFDTGEPDPSSHPLLGFMKGTLLVVVHGPVVVEGVEWYLLTPAQLSVDVPTGWSPISSESGEPLFEPGTFDCLTSPIAAEQLSPFALTDGLPVCYGATELTIVGELVCRPEPDSFATGATWLEGGICSFDAPLSVYGLDPELAPGRYEVTGHFDDSQSRDCRPPDGDQSPEARLNAVLLCRRAFVATSANAVSVP
jgi:hypothetical protein